MAGPNMTSGTSSSRTRWLTDSPCLPLKDWSCVTRFFENHVALLIDGELILTSNRLDFGAWHPLDAADGDGYAVAKLHILGHQLGDVESLIVLEGRFVIASFNGGL